MGLNKLMSLSKSSVTAMTTTTSSSGIDNNGVTLKNLKKQTTYSSDLDIYDKSKKCKKSSILWNSLRITNRKPKGNSFFQLNLFLYNIKFADIYAIRISHMFNVVLSDCDSSLPTFEHAHLLLDTLSRLLSYDDSKIVKRLSDDYRSRFAYSVHSEIGMKIFFPIDFRLNFSFPSILRLSTLFFLADWIKVLI